MNVLKWSLLAASLGLAACSSGGSNPPVVTNPGDGGGNPPVVAPDPGDGGGNPPVVVPDPGDGGGNPPVVMKFWNWQHMETRTGGCFDGGHGSVGIGWNQPSTG